MKPAKDSYQIKEVCKICNKVISPKVERIKSHLLKCGKDNDLGEYEEIASLVRVWDKKIGSKNPKKVMSVGEDGGGGGGGAPGNKDDNKTWTDDETWRNEMDKKYLHNVIDYNEFPNKRYRSDSENTNESDNSPDPKKFKY